MPNHEKDTVTPRQVTRSRDVVKPGRPIPLAALGGSGDLRADTPPLIDARNDLEAVAIWLWERGEGSEATKASYWMHIERFLLWASEAKGKSLSEVTVNDIIEYRDFLKDPQPKEFWCGPRAPRGSSRWRPFRGPLSDSSRALSLNIISSLMTYLCSAGYLRANPALLVRKPKQSNLRHQRVERFLHEGLLKMIFQIAQRECQNPQSKRDWRYAERRLWVFILLSTLGMRRDEVVSSTHGSFELKQRPTGNQWWCRIMGKGGHERVIPCPKICIDALARYRGSLGLEPTPSPGEETPMVLSASGKKAASGTTIYRAITDLFAKAALEIEDIDPEGSATLRKASPHWLRHSFITSQGNLGVSLRHRKLSAGHASVETTMRYDHARDDDWYEDMQSTFLDSEI